MALSSGLFKLIGTIISIVPNARRKLLDWMGCAIAERLPTLGPIAATINAVQIAKWAIGKSNIFKQKNWLMKKNSRITLSIGNWLNQINEFLRG
jgi:hypothetical protein